MPPGTPRIPRRAALESYGEDFTMFITKKHLSRRTVLRGAGTAVALPLLDAMIPARIALAQTAAKPTPHLGFVYFPHGAVMNRWTPTRRRQHRRVRGHPEAARQVQVDDHGIQQHRQSGGRGPGARSCARDVALLCSPGHQPGGAWRNHGGPDLPRNTSARIRRCLRWRSRPKTTAAADSATAITAAPTREPFRSARPPLR